MPGPIKPRHHVVTEATSLAKCLERHFQKSAIEAAELVALGAVYRGGERLLRDEPLRKGDHLIIHLHPTRFPVEGIDWRKRIVAQTADFLIVDKPAAVPVHATADNLRDNLLFHLREATGEALLVTQRLDTPVAGLMVLARTESFQRDFNRWLADKQVRKTYRALTVKTVPKGLAVHYLEPSEKTPRVVSAEEKAGWQRAELDILRADTVMLPASTKPFVEVELRLLTGRTHQIRAQLSAMGAPIVGDKLYRSTVRYSKLKYGRGIALVSSELSFPGLNGKVFTIPPPWSASPG